MIPKEARPHEVAIILLWQEGKNVKQIVHELHYRKPQPVRRVISKWILEGILFEHKRDQVPESTPMSQRPQVRGHAG